MWITALKQRNKYSLKAIFWLVAILLGALQAGANRYNISSDDGISYLDIGDAYFRGEWNTAINAQWSPIYSWLLGSALYVFKPSPYWEFSVVKLVNFLIYLFAIVCFEFFLSELRLYYLQSFQDSPNKSFKIPEWAWVVLGYTLFIWSSLEWLSLYSDTPDICTAALVYLASGIILRVQTRPSWFNFIILGVILGFAYLSKTVMFPLAFVFLAVAMFSVGKLQRALPRAFVALLAFTIITSPFIVAISTKKGYLTYGDTGKLNYAFLINPGFPVLDDHHWQGEPSASGTPKHPTRMIFENPAVFEFATPIGGTYPPWYDPTYWYEGLTLKFDLVNQVKAVAKNFVFYYKRFLGSLVFGYLIVVGTCGNFWLSIKDLTKSWRLLILAAAGLSAYMLYSDLQLTFMETQPSTRLIAVFVVLLFAGVFSSVRLPNSQEARRLIAAMTIAVLVIVGSHFSFQASKVLFTILKGQEHTSWQVAEGLRQLGIQPGDRVAMFTDKYSHSNWARLARVKIVAEIPDANGFWKKDAVVKDQVLKTIEKTGARILVNKPESEIVFTGWQEISNTGNYVYFLR